MKHIFTALTFSLFFAFFNTGVRAQEITVRDVSTFKTVEGVRLSWKKGEISGNSITSRTGKAVIDSLSENTVVTFERIGYETTVLTYGQIRSSQFEVGIYKAIYSFDEVVISASKHAESKRDITQQIELIDARETELLNRQTTADLLQASGQVMVQKSQAGGGSPVLRGFEANKVLLVVDGIRMNNAIFRGGHLQNVLTIDQNMLERTEVTFGPGSVVYGSDALGGVVHFRTKNPAFSSDSTTYLLANAMTRFASANNELTLHAGVETGGRKLSSYTAVTASRFDDLRMGANRNDKYSSWGKRDSIQAFISNQDSTIKNPEPNVQSESGYNQIDIIQKLSHRINSNLIQRLNIQFSTPLSDIPRYDRLTEKTEEGIFRFAEWNYGRQDRLLTSYELTENKSRKLYTQASVIAAYQRVGESRVTRRYNSGWRDSRVEELDIFSFNADFEKRNGSHETRYGFEYYYNFVNSTSSSENIFNGSTREIDTRYPTGGSTMSSAAAYLTHTWEVSEKTIINGGIRYTGTFLEADFGDTAFYKIQTGTVKQSPSALSGSAGIVYLPSQSSKLSLSLASGFRSPNIDDLAKVFESGNGTVIVPNPDLGPEYTYTAEAGFSKSFSEKVFLEGYGWYTLYRDAITLGNYTYNGNDSIVYDGEPSAIKANVNAGEAYLYGGTFILKAALSKHFRLTSSLTYTFGRIVTDTADTPLDHIPPLFGRTGIEYEKSKLILTAYAEYHGKKSLDDYNVNGEDNIQYATVDGTPGWVTFNLGGSYAISKKITLQSSLENILDTHYRVFASGISAPGRNFVIAVRAEF